jgi:FkbM family methyltransferase
MRSIAAFNYKGCDVTFTHFSSSDYIHGFHCRGVFYEQDLLEYIKNTLGDASNTIIIDAGSNVGNHTVFFAKYLDIKQVLSIEANTQIYETLVQNIDLNNIRLLVTPINAICGETDLIPCASHLNSNNNIGGSIVRFGTGEALSRTLDSIYQDLNCTDNVSLIKIDCEGVDFEVLKGASTLIDRFAPLIMIEVFPSDIATKRGIKTNLSDYYEYLRLRGYRLIWHDQSFNYVFAKTK